MCFSWAVGVIGAFTVDEEKMFKWGKDARLGLVLVCCGVSLTASICQSTTLYF